MTDVQIRDIPDPPMIDATPAVKAAATIATTVLGYAVATGEHVPQAFLSVTLIAVFILVDSTFTKWARNRRVAEVQTQAIHSAGEAGADQSEEVE